MFGRSIFIFIFLMACLAIATILLIEDQTGKHILPRNLSFIPQYKISQAYMATRIKAQYWWAKVMDEKPAHIAESNGEKSDPSKPEIIKWQDKDGTWHFEYQKTLPPANP